MTLTKLLLLLVSILLFSNVKVCSCTYFSCVVLPTVGEIWDEMCSPDTDLTAGKFFLVKINDQSQSLLSSDVIES